MALLKRDHGIEVKSASSTIEEVVGRQFVDRLARQRGVTLPSGDVFAEGAAAKVAPKKPALVKKGAAPEPAKPAAPTLGPPRLVKAAKAIHQAERAAAASTRPRPPPATRSPRSSPPTSTTPRGVRRVDHAPVEEVSVTAGDARPTPSRRRGRMPVAELASRRAAPAQADDLAAEADDPAPQAHADSRCRPAWSTSRRAASCRRRCACVSRTPTRRSTPRPPARPAPPRPRRGQPPAAAAPARRGSWDRRREPARRRWRRRGLASCRRGPRRRAVRVRRTRRPRRLAARVRCPASRCARSSPAWARDPACPAGPACRRLAAHGPDSPAAGVRRHRVRRAAAGTPRGPSSRAARWRRRRRRRSPRTSRSPRA